jgi:hypothetical protein
MLNPEGIARFRNRAISEVDLADVDPSLAILENENKACANKAVFAGRYISC